jgi:hypothetical protein
MRSALLLVALCASTACATADDDATIELANPDDEGKDDSISGKRLHAVLRGEWRWQRGADYDAMRTDVEVLSRTSSDVRVRALRIGFELRPGEVLDLAADEELLDIGTDIAFLLYTRDSSEQAWALATCEAQTYYERIKVDPTARTLGVQVGGTGRTFTWDQCGIPHTTTSVAVFPFPSSNWFGLEGNYRLQIGVRCNGTTCL